MQRKQLKINAEVEKLAKEELQLQLESVMQYNKQLEKENRALREEKTIIHNRITELWKFDYVVNPLMSRKLANDLHVNFDNNKFSSKLEDTMQVLEAVKQIRRVDPEKEDMYKTLEKFQKAHQSLVQQLEREKAKNKAMMVENEQMSMTLTTKEVEHAMELAQVKQELKVALAKQKEVRIVKESSKPQTKVLKISRDGLPVQETVEIDDDFQEIIERMKKEVMGKGNPLKEVIEEPVMEEPTIEEIEEIEESMEIDVEESKVEKFEIEEEKMIEKADNLAIYSLLKEYNPTPPKHPIHDCDIEYKGEKAVVYTINEIISDYAVFDEITKNATKIFFIGDDEQVFHKSTFIYWLLATDNLDRIEHSFTLKEKLAKTNRLENLKRA